MFIKVYQTEYVDVTSSVYELPAMNRQQDWGNFGPFCWGL
jgi:hypothetical protein